MASVHKAYGGGAKVPLPEDAGREELVQGTYLGRAANHPVLIPGDIVTKSYDNDWYYDPEMKIWYDQVDKENRTFVRVDDYPSFWAEVKGLS